MTRLFYTDPQSAEESLLNTWDDYGIDEEAPYPDVETDNDVVIPESPIHLRATVCKNQTKSEICGKVQIFYCALILDLS